MQVRGPKSGFRKTIPLRRALRKNTTVAEQIFWAKAADREFLNLKFRKQHAIGNYIVDFYCPELKLIVEIDGDTHAFNESIMPDIERTLYLQSFGYRVIRYNNRDVLDNIDGVFQDLQEKIVNYDPPYIPPHEGGKVGGISSRGGERGRSPHAWGEGNTKPHPNPLLRKEREHK